MVRHWTARLAESKPKPTEEQIPPLSHSLSFHAKAADAAPSSPPRPWLTELVLWLQTSLFSPLQAWERGQVSSRQDMLQQQRCWHSSRTGLYSAGVVRGCLDRRRPPGISKLSAALASLSVDIRWGAGGVCGLCISTGRGHSHAEVLSALGERNSVYQSGEERQSRLSWALTAGVWKAYPQTPHRPPPAGLTSSSHKASNWLQTHYCLCFLSQPVSLKTEMWTRIQGNVWLVNVQPCRL